VIFKRLLLALTAAAAFAAGAAVGVVALAFALYALVEPRLGRAGAAATVAATTMAIMVLAGVVLATAGRRKPPRHAPPATGGAVERAFDFVKRKPVVAVSAAVGLGLMAVRNPRYLGEALRAFFDGKPPPK
jgi:branched-subunit amino acid ABC-type transport system permease component